MQRLPGVEPHEVVAELMTVSFGGSAAATSRGVGITSTRSRMRSFDAWRAQAEAAGFPAPGPDLVVGVSDRRLLVWQPAFWWPRPKRLAGSVPFDRLAAVTVYRSGLVTQMALLLDDGTLVILEALRARRVQRLARAFPELPLAPRHPAQPPG